MRMVLAAIAASALAAPAFAETRTIEAAPFYAIEASGPYRVDYVAADEASISVSGAARDLNDVRIRVVNGVLRISQRCALWCGVQNRYRAAIRAASPRIDRFDVSKGVDARARGVAARQFVARVSMGGALDLAGSCERLDANVSMGGNLSAGEMNCNAVTVDASMGGAAKVRANDSVRAAASMGGVIQVRGEPRERRASSSMGGAISID